MRLLANENVPLVTVQALRKAGHATAWIREDAPGIADAVVLERAVRERRLLLTFDRGFGALVYRRGATASRGIVLFRIILPPDEMARFVVSTLASRSDWEGSFSVVEAGRIRMRGLPSRGP